MTAPAAEMRASGTVATLETAAADPAEDSCPICGHAGAALWLRAPDRFHGREVEYTLLRCPSCSLVWLTNPPKPEEMGEHYTEAYDRLISAAGQNSPFRWADRKAALT